MVDVVDKATRSRMMAAVRGKNTRPEIVVRSYLHGRGFRFRLHKKGLPGHPDIVLPRYRTVVFVHGCFWHRHEGCRFAAVPGSRKEFWRNKFEANVSRDRRQVALLRELGWRVIVVWECETDEAHRLRKLEREITRGHQEDGRRRTGSIRRRGGSLVQADG